MRLTRAVFGVAAVGLAVACGGQSREAETASPGSSGGTDPGACQAGQGAYQQKRAEVLQSLSSRGCTTDTDCGSLWETNACVSTCGVAVPAAGVDAARQELNAFAEDRCHSCAPIPVPPCVPPQPIQCIQGRCEGG